MSKEGFSLLEFLIIQFLIVITFLLVLTFQKTGLQQDKNLRGQQAFDGLLSKIFLISRNRTMNQRIFLDANSQPIVIPANSTAGIPVTNLIFDDKPLASGPELKSLNITIRHLGEPEKASMIVSANLTYFPIELVVAAERFEDSFGATNLTSQLFLYAYVDTTTRRLEYVDAFGAQDIVTSQMEEDTCQMFGGTYQPANTMTDTPASCQGIRGTTGGMFGMGEYDRYAISAAERAALVEVSHHTHIYCENKNVITNGCSCPSGYKPFLVFDVCEGGTISCDQWDATYICVALGS